MTAPRRPAPGQGDWEIAVPFFAGAMIIALIGFWPAMVWHGYTGTGGWKWDIHSTIAEAVYFGVAGFIAVLVYLGNRPARTAVKPKRERPWPPPKYVPPPAAPDPAVTARLLRDLEAADSYAGQVEEARSAEELDYLRQHGKLPDGWPFRNPQ